MGDPRLWQQARPIERFDRPDLHALIADMEETKLEKLLLNLFSTTSAIGADGVSKVALSDIEAISMASEYDHGAVVKLALEVAP